MLSQGSMSCGELSLPSKFTDLFPFWCTMSPRSIGCFWLQRHDDFGKLLPFDLLFCIEHGIPGCKYFSAGTVGCFNQGGVITFAALRTFCGEGDKSQYTQTYQPVSNSLLQFSINRSGKQAKKISGFSSLCFCQHPFYIFPNATTRLSKFLCYTY